MLKDVNVPCASAFEFNYAEEHVREDLGIKVYCTFGRFPFEKSVYLHDVYDMNFERMHDSESLEKAIQVILEEFDGAESIFIGDWLYRNNKTFWNEKGFSKDQYFINNFYDHIWIFDPDTKKYFMDVYHNRI